MTNGTPLSEIAGMTDYQMRWIYFRERNQYGALVRDEEEDKKAPKDALSYNPQTFEEMYLATKQHQGLTLEQAQKAWRQYVEDNPSMKQLIQDRERRLERRKNRPLRRQQNGKHSHAHR